MAALLGSLILLLAGGLTTRAERYLTVAEAQKTCFSSADRFEARVVRLTPEQSKAIQAATRQKVLIRGNRIWLAFKGTNLLGVLVVDHVLGKHEMIDYAVAVGPDGAVQRIEILEYRESHGGEIRGNNWRSQFKGKSARSPLRLNEDVYNISGATISCRNVSEGVRRVLATFDQVLRPDLVAAGLLPGPDRMRPQSPSPGHSGR